MTSPARPDLRDLGAKTAALREKLEKSRRQNSTYIPHELPPKRPANVSLEATDDDIQELITSIRVTSGGGNEDETMPSVNPQSSEALNKNQQANAANSQVLPNNRQADTAKAMASSTNPQPYSLSFKASSKNEEAYAANSQVYTGIMQAPLSASTELVSGGQYALSTDSQAIQELLERVPDIKDWLAMTEYHNTEARTVKLDRFRRLRNLVAEKQRLEEEERRLLQEQEHDFRPQQRQAKVAPLLTHIQAVTETRQSLPTPITPNKPEAKGDNSLVLCTSKRAHPEEGAAQQGRYKIPRSDQDTQMEDRVTAPSEESRRSVSMSNHPVSSRYHGTAERSSSRCDTAEYPPPHQHSHREASNPHPNMVSPPRGPRTFGPRDLQLFRHSYGDSTSQKNTGGTRSRYDSYKGSAARDSQRRRSMYNGREAGNSRRLDLGRQGDTRFFIVKSFNDENVQQCMEDNLWTTQAHNSMVFSEAFEQCKNVILFFSINQSGHFQGYARMVTPPSDGVPRPKWMKGLHWESSEPFALEWLSTTPIEFTKIRYIHNSLNENCPVFVGKDGQEIETGAGIELLREMDLVREREREREHRYGGRRWTYQRDDYHEAVVKRESPP